MALCEGAADSDRIKEYGGQPQGYWTRSQCALLGGSAGHAYWHYSFRPIAVTAKGASQSDGQNALYALGVAAILVIG